MALEMKRVYSHLDLHFFSKPLSLQLQTRSFQGGVVTMICISLFKARLNILKLFVLIAVMYSVKFHMSWTMRRRDTSSL